MFVAETQNKRRKSKRSPVKVVEVAQGRGEGK